MTDEQKLVKDCLKGDRKAQFELYRQFAGKLYGMCLRYGNTVQDAQDILQEGFVLIFNKLHTFKFEGSLEGWMKKLMIRTAWEWLRKNKKHNSANDINEDSMNCIANESAIDEIEIEELNRHIRSLPPGFRMVFNLYAIEGYAHREIAAMLNISVNASKSQYSRAKKQLLAKMGTTTKEING